MSENIGSLGLCSTCRFVALCTTRKTYSRPVHFCEEFETETVLPSLANAGNGNAHSASGKNIRQRQVASDRFKGLCVNCDHRFVCKYLMPGEGVWHCEEYA